MRIFDLLGRGRAVLAEPNEASILLEFILKKPKEYFVAHLEASVSKARAEAFWNVCKRRASGIPLAYLTQRREFFGLDFYIDERVLIPRPETELLVEAVLQSLPLTPCSLPLTLCDIGTGSGCIAVALAKNLPSVRITAVDISKDALSVAEKNAKIHLVSAQIGFLESDLLERVPDEPYSAVVANLPYIGTSENHLIAQDVLDYEPHLALFGGENGLALFERLFQQMASRKHLPGFFAGEMGFLQRRGISELVKKYFGKVRIVWKNDLAGLPRVFIISLKKPVTTK